MDKYELFAVGHYFNDYPENMSYEKFITALQKGEDIEDCWPVAEYDGIPNEDMYHMVTSMVQCLRITFK